MLYVYLLGLTFCMISYKYWLENRSITLIYQINGNSYTLIASILSTQLVSLLIPEIDFNYILIESYNQIKHSHTQPNDCEYDNKAMCDNTILLSL